MSDPYIGEIKMFAGSFAPRGYANCDGQLLAISQYEALFSLFGTTYGGDGRTTFGLPDFRGRTPIHHGSGPGLTPRNLGQKGGQEMVALTSSQTAQHKHILYAENDSANETSPAGNAMANTTQRIYINEAPVQMHPSGIGNSPGSSQAHPNMSAYQTIRFIVALIGTFPSRS
ncbi:phage tail protein [Novipirellula maiorica]|uniref:phage tail protein n=1 Tax=Novipirellula maiorica TaxID=1265734 RepID=UPI0005930AB0|nr:tail fiber protein [Rhodopirellula maiorica]